LLLAEQPVPLPLLLLLLRWPLNVAGGEVAAAAVAAVLLLLLQLANHLHLLVGFP